MDGWTGAVAGTLRAAPASASAAAAALHAALLGVRVALDPEARE
jgi:hypothetical protein